MPLPFNPPILISHWGKSSPAATRCLKEKGGKTGKTRRPTLWRAIVEALTRVAPRLKQAERLDLLTEVLALTKFAGDATAYCDLAGPLAVARQANKVVPRRG